MSDNYWKRYLGRKSSRRRVLAGGGAAAIGTAALLAGCGDDGDDAPASSAATAAATSAATSAATAAATAASGGGEAAATAAATEAVEDRSRYGGTFNSQKAAQNTTLDPSVTVTDDQWTAVTYNHLLHYSLVEEEAWGDAAESWEQVDATTLVFKLRDGIRFNPEAAGGREQTSADVAYSYSRFPDSLNEMGSEVNQVQWGWMGVDRGASFDTPDDKTLVINQSMPFASNIACLGSSAMGIVAQESVEAGGGHLKDTPNAGGGAYMFSSIDESGNSYVRNPNYYEHPKGLGRFNWDMPYIDAWRDDIVPDGAARESRFLAGDSDYFGAIDRIKAAEFEGQPNVTVHTGPSNDHSIMQLDAYKWLPHPKLREALSLAIDWDGYIDVALAGEGVRGTPVGSGFKSLVLPQDEVRQLQQYDPVKAKALWEAGGGDDVFPELTTIIATFSASTIHIEFIAKSIEDSLGVKVNLVPADLANYVAIATAPPPDKIWDFFIAGENSLPTIPDYNALNFYTPDGYGAVFGSLYYEGHPAIAAGYLPESELVLGVTNEWGTKMHDYYMAQGASFDPVEREGIIKAWQRDVYENFCCVLPLPVQSRKYFALGSRVQNVPPLPDTPDNAATGFLRAHNMYLDPQ